MDPFKIFGYSIEGSNQSKHSTGGPFFHGNGHGTLTAILYEWTGFWMKNKWTPRGTVEWCRLQKEGAAIMLQGYRTDGHPVRNIENKKDEGVAICFICEDALALYQEFISKGINPAETFIGNNMWDVGVIDPNSYHLPLKAIRMFRKKPGILNGRNSSGKLY